MDDLCAEEDESMTFIAESFGIYIKRRPRIVAAIAFGCTTAVATHFAWYPDARTSGYIPVLTLAVGLCHALAGIITGRRLMDRTRTKTLFHSCLIGAGTSLLAMAFFTPPFALWISASNVRSEGIFSYLYLTLLIGLFSFVAIGWVLLLVSIWVGWMLYRVTTPEAES
ncbi:MAG TPA: hypothetical protein VLX91_15250 [Candidatus Acidoferrales bacterium]|nr:hypothetical protein [Candidatus Acidoferrales bacterium]